MHSHAFISTHLQGGESPDDSLVNCIKACFYCAQTCVTCADACLGEETAAGLAHCIRFDLDCADACAATGSVLTRGTATNEALLRQMVETCAELCRACADECDRHGRTHEHCRMCAKACRLCESACREVASSLGRIRS